VKLAIVIERFEAWRGGAETSTHEIARLLAAWGHDIHIVTATNSQSPPDMTIQRVPSTAVLPALRTAAFVRNVTAFLQANRFDLVHAIAPIPSADVYQPRGGLLGETMQRNVATRKSASRRLLKRAMLAMNVKQRALLDLERQIFATAHPSGPRIIAVSNYVARQCERHYGVGPPRVRVVFNGVNTVLPPSEQRVAQRAAVRSEYHIANNKLLLLFIAHNFRLKGLDPLIDTLSRLATADVQDFHLFVVGRDNPARYQRRLRALRLDRFVTFTGPTQRVNSFYFAADVCVHPTYYDPCSRVVLEALSYGVPCITTAFNGASEIMTDGAEGFVIDTPDHVGLWARRIQELRSADLRGKMSEKALLLRDKLTMARHVSELDAIFTEVVQSRTTALGTVSAGSAR